MTHNGEQRGSARDVETLLHDPQRGCVVTYAPRFLSEGEADSLFVSLRGNAPFVAEAPVVMGKVHLVSRASCAFGEEYVRYRYAGVLREAAPWPEPLLPILEKLEERVGLRFNFVLCNLYPDGKAGLGWHADDERDLEAGAPIASISLGAVRDFFMRRTFGDRAIVVRKAPEHGSLLLMAGGTQKFYAHQVPKRARCSLPRINLTFRKMREPASPPKA